MKTASLVLILAACGTWAGATAAQEAEPRPKPRPRSRTSASEARGDERGGQVLNERRAANKDARIAIENGAGSIRVIGWDKDEVQVTGTLGRRAEGLDFSGSAQSLRIGVETEGNPHGVRSDLEIHVPAGSRLEIDGFAAEVTVSGVIGSVEAESVNGSISVSGAAREVVAETVNGDVEVTGAAKRIEASSVNGAVTLKGVAGEIEASTVNGVLSVTDAALERAQLETVSGEVRCQGRFSARTELHIESVSGDVELAVPAGADADFDITSFSGHIENEFGQEPTRRGRHSAHRTLRFSLGSGSASVSISTLSGQVTLRKK